MGIMSATAPLHAPAPTPAMNPECDVEYTSVAWATETITNPETANVARNSSAITIQIAGRYVTPMRGKLNSMQIPIKRLAATTVGVPNRLAPSESHPQKKYPTSHPSGG